jgi:hypothetical protein
MRGTRDSGIIPESARLKITRKFLASEIKHSKKLKNDDLLTQCAAPLNAGLQVKDKPDI